MPEIQTQKSVTFYEPGSFFAEEYTEKLPDGGVVRWRPNAFAYTVQERDYVEVGGRRFWQAEPSRQIGPKHYRPGTKTLTSEEVRRLPGDHSTLLSNMRTNGWDPIALTPMGNFQPLGPGYVIDEEVAIRA